MRTRLGEMSVHERGEAVNTPDRDQRSNRADLDAIVLLINRHLPETDQERYLQQIEDLRQYTAIS